MTVPTDSDHSRETVIVNRRGLHARAAAKVAALAEEFDAEITVAANGVSATARSIMGLMLLAAGPGDPVRLAATGSDAVAALDAMAALVDAGFDEDRDGCSGRESAD